MTKRNIMLDKKVDAAVNMTFPTSDPLAAGTAAGTQSPTRPVERQAPLIRKEHVEQAQQGATTNSPRSSIDRGRMEGYSTLSLRTLKQDPLVV